MKKISLICFVTLMAISSGMFFASERVIDFELKRCYVSDDTHCARYKNIENYDYTTAQATNEKVGVYVGAQMTNYCGHKDPGMWYSYEGPVGGNVFNGYSQGTSGCHSVNGSMHNVVPDFDAIYEN
ncbi:MAG: hypothetical protein ACK5HS_00115 [Mycoplasmatales bacterium]